MKKLLLALVAFAAVHANALPVTSQNWSTIQALFTPGFNFQGIIALSNCSGSLVRFKTSQPTDLAMVLTNGHCLSQGVFGGFLQPGQVVVNEDRQTEVALLDKDGNAVQGLTTKRVLYATMTDTDVTLFELDKTYAEIPAPALTLADTVPAMGMAIQIPSGYWKRTYACQTEAIIPELKEADWTFRNSIRFSQPGCETIGGTSGSPLVSSATGEVIGINNTGNEDGEQCTMNNPCEVDSHGTETVRKGRSYGQQTYLFYGCLGTGANRIDLSKAGCALPKPQN